MAPSLHGEDEASFDRTYRIGTTTMLRTVSLAKLAAMLVALAALAFASYLVVAEWQLQRWLRSRAAELGCSLEYRSATALLPGHFRVDAVRLSDCNDGRWSARLGKAEGEVALRSLIWGPVQPEHVQFELDSLHVGAVALEGKPHLSIRYRLGAVQAQLHANKLSLREHERVLSSSGDAVVSSRFVASGGKARGTATFNIQSFTSTPLALAVDKSLAGNVQASWDLSMPRLELRDGDIPSLPVLLRGESLQATLRLHRLSWMPSGIAGTGRLLIQGQDAHVLLEVLKVPQALRFALSGLENSRFTLRTSVAYASGKWTFEQVELDADEASASGVVSIDGPNRAGTLRFVYRGLAMGVQFSNDQSNVVFDPADDWPRAGT
jgi:hypothetical protein